MRKVPLFIINEEALKLSADERKKIETVNEILGYGLVRNRDLSIDKLEFTLPTPNGVIDFRRNEFIPQKKEAR